MSRTYATIDAGIWSDAEFCDRTAGAQRTYFMLITQTDITACGTLPLTLRRWSSTCAEKDLAAWLIELTDHRFVLIDEDTEELLVRTFVKWDGGYKHPRRLQAVVATARAIRSAPLRTAAMHELTQLGVPLDRDSNASRVPIESDSGGAAMAIESRRSVVKEGDNKCTPHSTLQEREPSPPETGVEPSPFCSKHPKGTEAKCGGCQTARLRHAAWVKSEPERKRRAAAERRAVITGCPDCDENGMQLDPATGLPVRRCTHRRSA